MMTTSIRSWTASDLATSHSHVIDVAPEVARELQRPRAHQSSALNPLLDEIADSIERCLGPAGPGLAITTSAELTQCSDEELSFLLTALSGRIGRLVGQNVKNESVVVVSDTRQTDTETARGYLTNAEMRLHTDPTDVAALLCLRASGMGGANAYASCGAVLDALTDRTPELVHNFFRIWDWDLHGLQRPGVDQIVPTPVFSIYRGELSCRYGSRMLRDGAASRTGALSEADEQLLRLFETVAHQPELNLRHTLARGEIVWLNNYRVLHGRDAFEDCATAGNIRKLLRVWIWRHQPPSLAPPFRVFADAIDRPAGLTVDGGDGVVQL